MPEPTQFVTREEFDLVKEEQKRQAIRVEVLEDGLTSLTREVAGLREDMNARFDQMDARFDAFEAKTNGRFDAMHQLIADGNAAIISAVMTLAKK